MPSRLLSLLFAWLVVLSPVLAAQSPPENRTSRAIRRELLLLPRFGIFDHLAFTLEKGTVTLMGQVRTGQLKNDAERAVKEIEGVETVVNNIEVLPTSPHDDSIRLTAYRAIYRHDALERYAIESLPPIRIIVKNGHVTLEGVVNSQLDKTLAATQARSVPGVFSVTDNLKVEK
jgi:hyperosmotically inducible protein